MSHEVQGNGQHVKKINMLTQLLFLLQILIRERGFKHGITHNFWTATFRFVDTAWKKFLFDWRCVV